MRCGGGRRSSGRRSSLARVPAKELDGRAQLWENVDPRAAVGDVGAAPGGSLCARRAVGRAGRGLGGGRPRSSHRVVPPRLWSGRARGRLVLGRGPGSTARPRGRAIAAAPLPRRTGPRAARSPPCSAATGRHAGAGSLPALVGRGHARPRAPHGHPAGGAPPGRLRQQEPAVRPDLPRRRSRGGGVALRRRAYRARARTNGCRGRRSGSYAPRGTDWPPL